MNWVWFVFAAYALTFLSLFCYFIYSWNMRKLYLKKALEENFFEVKDSFPGTNNKEGDENASSS